MAESELNVNFDLDFYDYQKILEIVKSDLVDDILSQIPVTDNQDFDFYELRSRAVPLSPTLDESPTLKTEVVRSRTQLRQQLMRDQELFREREKRKRAEELTRANYTVAEPVPIPRQICEVRLPQEVLKVTSGLQNPTKYHILAKQKDQVLKFLNASVNDAVLVKESNALRASSEIKKQQKNLRLKVYQQRQVELQRRKQLKEKKELIQQQKISLRKLVLQRKEIHLKFLREWERNKLEYINTLDGNEKLEQLECMEQEKIMHIRRQQRQIQYYCQQISEAHLEEQQRLIEKQQFECQELLQNQSLAVGGLHQQFVLERQNLNYRLERVRFRNKVLRNERQGLLRRRMDMEKDIDADINEIILEQIRAKYGNMSQTQQVQAQTQVQAQGLEEVQAQIEAQAQIQAEEEAQAQALAEPAVEVEVETELNSNLEAELRARLQAELQDQYEEQYPNLQHQEEQYPDEQNQGNYPHLQHQEEQYPEELEQDNEQPDQQQEGQNQEEQQQQQQQQQQELQQQQQLLLPPLKSPEFLNASQDDGARALTLHSGNLSKSFYRSSVSSVFSESDDYSDSTSLSRNKEELVAYAAELAQTMMNKVPKKNSDTLKNNSASCPSGLHNYGLTDRMRKDNHNMVEKRRRTNINDRIKELEELLPKVNEPHYEAIKDKKGSKGSILQASVSYVKLLKDEIQSYQHVDFENKRMKEENDKVKEENDKMKEENVALISRMRALEREKGICASWEIRKPDTLYVSILKDSWDPNSQHEVGDPQC